MNLRKQVNKFNLVVLVFALAIMSLGGYAKLSTASPVDAAAGAAVVGSLDSGNVRAILAPTNGEPKRVVYFDGVVNPTGGTTTPVVSRESCGWGEQSAFRADAYLTGTMTGTAPTAAIAWQYSIDGGDNWIDVGTWTTINATVTPASQSNTVYDHDAIVIPLTTPVITPAAIYGDCWRAVVTFGGTGAVGANLTIVQYGK
jgi:hypothetical protein